MSSGKLVRVRLDGREHEMTKDDVLLLEQDLMQDPSRQRDRILSDLDERVVPRVERIAQDLAAVPLRDDEDEYGRTMRRLAENDVVNAREALEKLRDAADDRNMWLVYRASDQLRACIDYAEFYTDKYRHWRAGLRSSRGRNPSAGGAGKGRSSERLWSRLAPRVGELHIELLAAGKKPSNTEIARRLAEEVDGLPGLQTVARRVGAILDRR